MSEQLLPFESFAHECEYINSDNDISYSCNHTENNGENCIPGSCPLCRHASLKDLKKHDPGYLYLEYLEDFKEELSMGEAEDELLCADVGEEWVIVDEDEDET